MLLKWLRSHRTLSPDCRSAIALPALIFEIDRSTIGQNFGNAGSNFVGIITHANDSVRAQFGGMLNHTMVRVGPGFFTEFSVNLNVAAQQRLQRRANIADDAARPDHDAADDTEIFRDTVIGNLRDGR